MTGDITNSALTKIKRKMVAAKRNILLFMDNAPCHPENFVVSYSNMKVVFLPKNTTSRLHPAGIIRNFKVKYQKRLFKVVVSWIDGNSKASEIIQEIDVLNAITKIKAAWEEVSDQTVINCFCKFGFRKKAQDGDVETVDQDEDEEFANLVKELAGDADPDDYVDFDKDVTSSMPAVDADSISWRQKIRKEIIEKHENPADEVMDVSSNEDVDEDIEDER